MDRASSMSDGTCGFVHHKLQLYRLSAASSDTGERLRRHHGPFVRAVASRQSVD